MKATLEFTLPEEQVEFDMATSGPDFYLVISGLLEELRQKRKYEDVESLPIEKIQELLHDLLEERDVRGLFL